MYLPIIWESEGTETDKLVFQKRFKIYRGHAQPDTRRVTEEACYGILYYEPTSHLPMLADETARRDFQRVFAGIVGIINEIVAPVLTLYWAQEIVEMMEQGLFRASYLSCISIEDELRRRGYDGDTICPFHTADTIGFQIMAKISSLTIPEIEELAAVEGRIETYLKNRGFVWLKEFNTWQNASGNLWNRREEAWNVALPPHDTGRPGISRHLM